MVKRATIHVYSRTKKNHPKNGGLRGIKRKQQIQPIQDFTTKLPLQEKQVATCPGEAVVLVVYLAASIAQGEALFIVVKVVLVVFPTQQAASKQYDTTLSIHLQCPSVPRMKQKRYSYE